MFADKKEQKLLLAENITNIMKKEHIVAYVVIMNYSDLAKNMIQALDGQAFIKQ